MTPRPACDPRQALVLGTVPDDLRAALLALADQHAAEARAGAQTEQHGPAARRKP